MSWLLGSSKKQEEKPSELSFGEDAPDVSSFLGSANLDTARLHPLAGLDQGLEYLNIEGETVTDMPGAHGVIPIKDWTDDLCYGTGSVYLTGLGLGGAYGFAEGLRKTRDTASSRLRLNGILNAVTRRGPFLGNSAGVLALTYNLINSSIGHFRGRHDITNSLGAAALAGAVFRATKGVRPMAISSGLMVGAATVWNGIKYAFF